MKLDHRIGTLEIGKVADFVILDGNPLEDIRAVADVMQTYRDGQVVYERTF